MRVIRYSDEMINGFKDGGYWTGETFYDFWKKNAEIMPDKTALVDSRYRLTWKDAKTAIDKIASDFIASGLQKNDRIIIQTPNTVYGFLARIASERAGLISLTVYPYLRHKELDFMLSKTEAKAAVIPGIYRNFDYLNMFEELALKYDSIRLIYLSDQSSCDKNGRKVIKIRSLIEASYSNDRIKVNELKNRHFNPFTDVALLTSTSGSTGIPKIVEWNIAPRLCTSKARTKLWKLTTDDAVMAIAPHAGGAGGTLTYFAAPLVGAKIVLLEEFSADAALKLIEQERCTAIGVVPTHIVRMLDVDIENHDLSSLRFIRSAGGYLSPQIAAEAERRMGAVITSDLGTQDVGSVSGCSVDDEAYIRRRTVGKPLPGNEIRILDEKGRVLDDGVGELWFRGPNSPAGYYRDIESTMKVFNRDGWATTGDLVKFDKNGNLMIMGRRKNMIIRGGQNIYPPEIEGLLNESDDIAGVSVVGVTDAEYGERAVAFIIPSRNSIISLEKIREFLIGKKLAKYKIPEYLIVVEQLPTVGDSGKIDKNVLKKMAEAKIDEKPDESQIVKKTEQFIENCCAPKTGFNQQGENFLKHLKLTKFYAEKIHKNDTGVPADVALIVASLMHDIERAFIEDKDTYEKMYSKQKDGFKNKEFLDYHQERSSEIASQFLLKNGMDKLFVKKVCKMIRNHETGGDFDTNILKDADSLAFFETYIDYFVNIQVKRTSKEMVKSKLEWTYNRITSDYAKRLASKILYNYKHIWQPAHL